MALWTPLNRSGFDFWARKAHRGMRGGPMRRQLILGIGLLVLTTGCLARGMGPGAADLPVTRPVPGSGGEALLPEHPPDHMIIAREPPYRRVRELDAALMRKGPVVAAMHWSLFAVVVAF